MAYNARPLTAADEAVRRELAEAKELLARVEKRGNKSELLELREKLTESIRALSERMDGMNSGRRVEFPLDGDDEDSDDVGVRLIEAAVRQPASDDEMRALHRVNDDLRILCTILGVPAVQTKYFQRAAKELPYLKRSLDTGANGFANWVPTEFSSSLHEQVRLQLKVAALHDRINMPQDPYALPIEGTDATVYIQPERGDANDFLDSTKMVTPSFGDSSNTPGATVLTLTSTKLMARTTVSEEATEDVIIPVLPYLRDRKLPRAMADAEETATINGSTAATHMDSDVTSAADRRKAWNGYRKYAISASAAVTISNTQTTVSNVGVADLRTVRTRFGKYGVDTSDLAYVTGPVGLMKLLSARDPISESNPSPVLTLDKLGPRATILTGQMAELDGIPIIISQHVRENLNAFGVYDGVTTDRTMILLVNRPAYIYGDRRATRMRSKLYEETEQIGLFISQRLTFAHWFTTDPTVGYVYNIQT